MFEQKFNHYSGGMEKRNIFRLLPLSRVTHFCQNYLDRFMREASTPRKQNFDEIRCIMALHCIEDGRTIATAADPPSRHSPRIDADPHTVSVTAGGLAAA